MFYYRTSIAIALIILTGCGGGGGNDECNDSVACIQPDPNSLVDSTALLGSYNMSYSISSNSCAGTSPLRTVHEIYSATSGVGYHGIPTIELSSNTGRIYSGNSADNNTDGKTFFSAAEIGSTSLVNFLPNMDCVESITLDFFDLGSSTASVVRTSDIDCADAGEVIVVGSTNHCKVIYNGTGSFTP